jgi:hypothetical protein
MCRLRIFSAPFSSDCENFEFGILMRILKRFMAVGPGNE